MNTFLMILLLALVLVAIVALPKLFGGKDNTASPQDNPATAPPRTAQLASLRDIDASPLARWICDQGCAQTGIDLRGDAMALTRILEAAQQAQADIDSHGEAKISLPYIAADSKGPRHLELRITRDGAATLRRRL